MIDLELQENSIQFQTLRLVWYANLYEKVLLDVDVALQTRRPAYSPQVDPTALANGEGDKRIFHFPASSPNRTQKKATKVSPQAATCWNVNLYTTWCCERSVGGGMFCVPIIQAYFQTWETTQGLKSSWHRAVAAANVARRQRPHLCASKDANNKGSRSLMLLGPVLRDGCWLRWSQQDCSTELAFKYMSTLEIDMLICFLEVFRFLSKATSKTAAKQNTTDPRHALRMWLSDDIILTIQVLLVQLRVLLLKKIKE